jgi:hypothetical protein
MQSSTPTSAYSRLSLKLEAGASKEAAAPVIATDGSVWTHPAAGSALARLL